MGNLSKAAVSLYGTLPTSLASQFHTRKEEIVCRRLTIVLTGQGATTDIGASALGFQTLIDCSGLMDVTNAKGYLAIVDPTNNCIMLYDGAAAPAPVAVTTTVAQITVYGTLQTSAALT